MTHRIDNNDCIGCSACLRICPVFAITGDKETPFEINTKRCVDCGVCARVCPKTAIEDKNGYRQERTKKELWAKPVIDEEVCSACGICMHWCTPGAMGVSMPKYQGDIDVNAILAHPEKCIGCGLCERHCPLDSVRMVNDVQS